MMPSFSCKACAISCSKAAFVAFCKNFSLKICIRPLVGSGVPFYTLITRISLFQAVSGVSPKFLCFDFAGLNEMAQNRADECLTCLNWYHMYRSFIMMLRSLGLLPALVACLFVLSACTSDDEAADGSLVGNNPVMGSGPVAGDGFGGTGVGGAGVGSVMPGSQQDLVVNVGDRVFFGYDQSDLSAEARGTLDRQAAWLKQYSNVSITVEGHADERGTREYNLALGERRAAAVRSYLMSQGVDGSRINTISYGKERPAIAESNPAGWAQNRRGVTVVN
jgi:peptidoglycan-associated lipoprotein